MSIEIEDFINGKVFIENKEIKTNEYLSEIIKNYKQILKDSSKSSLIVTMDKERIEAILLLVLAIESFLNNLKNSSKTILDELEPGQIVIYDNKKVRFEGIEVFYGVEKIKLAYEDSNNSKEMINVDDAYKLSIYDGKSEKLNVMSSKKLKNKDSGKFLFGKLMGANLEQFKGIIEQQVVVTFPSKEYMNKLVSNIKVEIEGQKYDFTQIFPCKYYSDIDNGIDLKGNKLKAKELFIFTSRLDVAKALIQSKSEGTSLMLLSENTYKDYLGGIFDNLLSRKKLHKIFIHNTYENIDYVGELLERNISVYAWDKFILNERFKNSIKEDQFINGYINSMTKNILIEDTVINKALLDTREALLRVLKSEDQIVDKEKFMRSGFGLLKLFEKISIPINYYEKFNSKKENITKYFSYLEETLENNKLYFTNMQLITPVISSLRKVYELLYNNNPKSDILKTIIENKSIIICNDEIEKEYFIKDERFSTVQVITLKEFKMYDYNDQNLSFISFYNNILINQLPYVHKNNIQNILYYTEVIKYNCKVRKLNNCIESILQKNEIRSNQKYKNIEQIYYDKSIFKLEEDIVDKLNKGKEDEVLIIKTEEDENLIENYIKSSIKENYDLDFSVDLDELFDTSKESYSVSYNSEISEVRKKITFDDSRYAYITKNFEIFCIDNEGNYVIKNIEGVKEGEKIIFINEKSEDDLFELFYKIIDSDIFKNRYIKDYENMKYWKKVLKDYVNRYDGDYELVARELKMHNLDKTHMSIRQWINEEKIIGPREKEVYEAIGKVTMDRRLLHNWEEVYESCNTIRGFRTKFKKKFKSMVKASVVNQLEGEDELENLVMEVFGDLREYADIVNVIEIIDISEQIPCIRTNCLLLNNYNIKNGDDENECVSEGV